jgi:simple sugar transport system substrate-binding protein
LLEAEKRVESFDNGDVAYNAAKELFKKYPNLKGVMGTSSYDAPGVARAIEELGLVGKAFTSGTGMPLDNAALLESGVVKSLTLWDPALAGKAMISLAKKVLDGDTISGVVDLDVDGYTALKFKEGSDKVLEGEGWIVINADNVYDFGF